MGLKAALAFLLVLSASPSVAQPSTCWIKSDDACRQYIGKRLWVVIQPGNPSVVEVTFTYRDWTTANTVKLKSGASFLVKGVVKNDLGSDYAIQLNDGRTGWTSTSSPFLIDYDPVARSKQAAEECARRGQPKIGMTSSELIGSCWGRPLRILKKTTAAGVEESYVYGIGHVVKFSDGKVSEIVEAR